MSLLRGVLLAAAVIGALPPLLVPSGFAAAPLGLLGAALQSPALEAIRWDILIAVISLSIWATAETYVRKNWLALAALPVAWLVGLGSGLPLYLFLRLAHPR